MKNIVTLKLISFEISAENFVLKRRLLSSRQIVSNLIIINIKSKGKLLGLKELNCFSTLPLYFKSLGRLFNMTTASERLRREIERLISKPPEGITCYPENDKLTKLNASVHGTVGSPYESGIFRINIYVPAKYPFEPPRLRFLTKIYHPNIDEAGRICLNLLKVQPEGNWRPTVTIEGVLIAVQLLMSQPSPDDPLVDSIGNEIRFNKTEYLRKAKEWTLKYAC